MPLWQTVLLLAVVAGVYWLTRESHLPPGGSPATNSDGKSDRRQSDRWQTPADVEDSQPGSEQPQPKIAPRRQTGPIDRERIEPTGDARPASIPPVKADRANDSKAAAHSFSVPNVSVRDRDGKVAWRGTVDLTDTIARIEAGERLHYNNDGIVFQNRERRLPRKASGYYHEYVHPTPGLSGPGPQRVVAGQDGEIYYTSDHYRSFTKIRGP